jgi:NhaA family Na+:H+ antiporter
MKTTNFFLRGSEKPPIERVMSPFQAFLKAEATGGIILLVCTAIALAWANSPWSSSYRDLWHSVFSVGIGNFSISYDLHHWINDGLMAVFFFVVGLEIKREIMVGELAEPRKAALPIAAAIGGMVVPAVFYFIFNPQNPDLRGWGVPMATDIAFSLGVLALAGSGVPTSAKIFLTAFAIVDDIGASLVIAVFYTEEIFFEALILGAVFFGAMLIANWAGLRKPLPYAILGGLLWLAFLKSGVHPTIAGILAALTIPARTRINAKSFLENSKVFVREFEKRGLDGEHVLTSPPQKGALHALESACQYAQTPLQRFEHSLHPWVSLFIMPIFALANTGVPLAAGLGAALSNSVSLGIIAGLVLGKQLGVTFFAWIAHKFGWADLPVGVSWRHIYGIAWLGGIGFTMSLFIASLAFKDETVLNYAKVGILTASLLSGVGGWLILRKSR